MTLPSASTSSGRFSGGFSSIFGSSLGCTIWVGGVLGMIFGVWRGVFGFRAAGGGGGGGGTENHVYRGLGLGHVRPHVGEDDGQADGRPVEQNRNQCRAAAPELLRGGNDVVEHEPSVRKGGGDYRRPS